MVSLQVHTFSSGRSPSGGLNEYDQQDKLPLEEISHDKDAPMASPSNQEEGEEGVADGANKFYCYLCSITCHNQQVRRIQRLRRYAGGGINLCALLYFCRTSGVT